MRTLQCSICALSLAGLATAEMRRQLVNLPSIPAFLSPTSPDVPSSTPVASPPSPPPTSDTPPPASPPPATSTPNSPALLSIPPVTVAAPPPADVSSAAPAPVPAVLSSSSLADDRTSSAVELPTSTDTQPTSTTNNLVSTSYVVVMVSGGGFSSSAEVVNLASASVQDAGDGSGSNTSDWAIPVGVVGGLIGAGLLGFLAWWFFKKRAYHGDDPADFNADMRWPTLPDDGSHLPPSSLRQTGAAGIGDDGDGTPHMTEMSPQSKSRSSSILDYHSQPYSDDHSFNQYSNQYGHFDPYAGYSTEAAYTPTEAYEGISAPYEHYGQVSSASPAGPGVVTSPSSRPSTAPDHYDGAPILPYAPQASYDGDDLGRIGSVRSVQSLGRGNGQRALGVVNPDN